MIDDTHIQVLIERVNNTLDGLKKIEGKLDNLFAMQLSLTQVQEQMKNVQSAQSRLFEKVDETGREIEKLRTEDMQPLRDEMIGNRRGLRVLGVVGSIVVAVAGALYSQYKPWQEDMAKAKGIRDEQISRYQFDIGQELRKDDNRLTVLEFRANNVDGKTSK
jgi:hypothetical protein